MYNQIVTQSIAHNLALLGFNEESEHKYVSGISDEVPAPTIYQCMEWMRLKLKLWIVVYPYTSGKHIKYAGHCINLEGYTTKLLFELRDFNTPTDAYMVIINDAIIQRLIKKI